MKPVYKDAKLTFGATVASMTSSVCFYDMHGSKHRMANLCCYLRAREHQLSVVIQALAYTNTSQTKAGCVVD